MNQSRRKMDQADEDYLETVTDAFEQCCRAVIVRLDDDSSFDDLLDGPLADDLEAYDEGDLSSSEYVRRIYKVLTSKKSNSLLRKADQAFLAALDDAGPVLHYLNIQKKWDRTQGRDVMRVLDLLADIS